MGLLPPASVLLLVLPGGVGGRERGREGVQEDERERERERERKRERVCVCMCEREKESKNGVSGHQVCEIPRS